MAQHFGLNQNKEPKIFASVARLGKYIARAISYSQNLRNPYKQELIYRKLVTRLGDEYKTEPKDSTVFLIGRYTLEDKEFREDNEEITANTVLECHFDKKGNIVNIYFVA